jgi:hypothetical protein
LVTVYTIKVDSRLCTGEGSYDPVEWRIMKRHVHVLSEIQADTRTATCAACGPGTPIKTSGHGGWRCRVAYRALPANKVNSGDKSNARVREELLAAQGGVCALCKRDSPRWCLDHDHANGMARSVLCYSCNVGLGQFGDDAERLIQAVDYLDLWSRKHATGDYPMYRTKS